MIQTWNIGLWCVSCYFRVGLESDIFMNYDVPLLVVQSAVALFLCGKIIPYSTSMTFFCNLIEKFVSSLECIGS